jgi:hypothetical protein
MQKCDHDKIETIKDRVVDKRIDGINNELDYLNEEFDIIRNGVGNIIRITNEESQLKTHQSKL